MDWLLARQGRVEEALARRHLTDGGLILYDVTSTYFALRRSVVAPGQRSPRAKTKALTKRTEEGAPVHSFPSLLRHLRTIVKDRMRLKSDPAIEFDKLTTPTPLQQRAFDLLGISLTL